MKKYIITIFLLSVVACLLKAQDVVPVKDGKIVKQSNNIRAHLDSTIRVDSLDLHLPSDSIFLPDSLPADSLEKEYAKARLDERAKADSIRNTLKIYGWKISPRLGEIIYVDRDTSHIDFHKTTLVDGKDVAVSYLGNIGSAAQSKIFFNRPESSRFSFLDVFSYWRKNPEDQIFLNTKIPYSNIFYQESGSKQYAENRFTGTLSSNFGKRLNVGFDVDYLYARGFYANLSNKHVSYDLNASYIGEKYSMHAFFGFNNFYNNENGGITNPLYITNPDSESLGRETFNGKSDQIPVHLKDTWNRLRGRHFFMTNRYNLGDDEEEYRVNDSTLAVRKKENYIAPASIILTTHYNDQRRSIKSNDNRMDTIFYHNVSDEYKKPGSNPLDTIKYLTPIDDYMSYYSFKNTLALAMNEGFQDWVKFGLTAFVEYDIRKFSIPDNIGFAGAQRHGSENVLTIGGVLAKEKGRYLRYKAWGEKNLLDSDFRLEGEVGTTLKFRGKDISAKARAYIKQIKPSYFENNFSSKYWNWSQDFSDIRRVFIGGEIEVPFTKTRISGGVENIQHYIYYGPEGFAMQKSGSVQVISVRLDQRFDAGIFHWDNQVVYQMTSDDEVIPLPDLSLYSNIYLTASIAKVLHMQLGADAHFHTSYYAPGYNPLTLQFYNQRDTKLGNFPIASAYMNLVLKNTRFFIMYYNITKGMGNGQAFTVPNYPVNPSGIRFGLSWKFNN